MTPTHVLSEIGRGGHARIVSIDAEPATRRRLAELGLTPGLIVRVVQSSGGPLVLSSRGSRIALGRSLAARVSVVAMAAGEVRS